MYLYIIEWKGMIQFNNFALLGMVINTNKTNMTFEVHDTMWINIDQREHRKYKVANY